MGVRADARLWICALGTAISISCAGAQLAQVSRPAPQLVEQSSSPPERPLPSKADWLERIATRTDEEIDLVEAAMVLALDRSGTARPYSTLSRSLEPWLAKVRSSLPSDAGPSQKIEALNSILLPAIRTGRQGEFSWLFEVFGSDRGGCIYSVLLYTIAAEALGVRVTPVIIPRHVFLCHQSPEGRRNIETTGRGEHLTADEYRALFFSTGEPSRIETLPEEPAALDKCMAPATRRQFVATLICGADPRQAKNTDDFDAAERIAPGFYYPLKLKAGYLASKGMWASSEELLGRVIALAPYLPGLYGSRAGGRIVLKKEDLALKDIDAALALAPHYPQYHLLKGLIHYQSGRLEDALACLGTAVGEAPGAAEFRSQRGSILRKAKRYKEAIEDYTKAIELDPRRAAYYQARAELWAILGEEAQYDRDREKAKALQRDP